MSSFHWYNGSLSSEKILLNYYCVVTRLKMRKWTYDVVVNERVKKNCSEKWKKEKEVNTKVGLGGGGGGG